MTLPDCMMPDGADPCVGYTELRLFAEKAISAKDSKIARLREALNDMVLLTTHANRGAFSNGVEHNGIDEGEVIAGQIIDSARAALAGDGK